MNERTPPFNNLKARQAVNYAIDRRALVNLNGGLGVPTWNFLPPNSPQYEKITPNPYPYNVNKAKQLVKQLGTAGDEGDRLHDLGRGRRKGHRRIPTGTAGEDRLERPDQGVGGSELPPDRRQPGDQGQIGLVTWFESYPYPTEWFDNQQNGQNIRQIHNNNVRNVKIPSINSQIDHYAHLPPSQALSASANEGWANIDHTLMVKYASTAPFMNSIFTSFFSSEMSRRCDVFDAALDDLAQFCLK